MPLAHIASLTPYSTASANKRQSLPNQFIALASNEGPLGPAPSVVDAITVAAQQIHRYPDGGATRLRTAIADHFGLDAARIVCGVGSDELITLLIRGYCGSGDEVLYSAHAFLMYGITAKSVGATPVAVPEVNYTADLDAMAKAVTPRTKIVFLANPNNPTGSCVTLEAVRAFHAKLPSDVLLVLDGAYAEYAVLPGYDPGHRLADTHANIATIRTFSKLYGLGGMRIGWGYGPANVVDTLHRVRGPFNVSSVAIEAATAALAATAHTEAVIANNTTQRIRSKTALETMGLSVAPSHGNFLMVDFGTADRAADVFTHLAAANIQVRGISSYGLPNMLRVSIGLPEEMDAFLASVQSWCEQTR
jgi:histidinol-phosphate aminotransferase